MKSFFPVSACLIFMAGCSTETLVEKAYPERAKYSFIDSYDEEKSVFHYYCERGPTEEETKIRAGKAHLYVTKTLHDGIETIMDEFLQKNGDAELAIAKTNALADMVSEYTETKYHCIVFPDS